MMFKVMSNTRKAMKSVENFIDTNSTWCENQTRNLTNMGSAELIRWSQEMLLPYAARSFWWMVGSAMYQSNLISKLRGELLELLGPDDTIALLSNVSTEDETLASLGVVASLDRLRRGIISREDIPESLRPSRSARNRSYLPPARQKTQTGSMSNWQVWSMLLRMLTPSCASSAPVMNLPWETCGKADPGNSTRLLKRLQEAARLTRV